MIWKRLTKFQAIRELENPNWNEVSVDESYTELADLLYDIYIKAEKETKKSKYLLDLYFAIGMFEIIGDSPWEDSTSSKWNMTVKDASDNGIWRFLSLHVANKIIYKRWSSSDNIADRICLKPARNYLKSLWWYIYLSKQKTKVATFSVLHNNSTDTIVSLVERTGTNGYDRELIRLLMSKVMEVKTNKEIIFRKLMKFHHAFSINIEPNLYEGGIGGYVSMLFSSIRKDEKKGK